ncbi:cytochrome P460 family protein [Chryseobacterium sp. A321]
MKKVKIFILPALVLVLVLIQFWPVEKTYEGEKKTQLDLPKPVVSILRNSCFDCHSNESKLKWYDKIAPASWIVNSDIVQGRAALNFSDWDQLPAKKQNAKFYYAINKILAKEMPLKSYALLHGNSLSENDVEILKDFATLRTPRKIADEAQILAASNVEEFLLNAENKLNYSEVADSPNGIPYIPDYKNWKVISTTDRFDNGTMRIIYGNDIAIEAIRNQTINPWPDGSILAKVAWKEQMDGEGNINTGEFLQVEYMIKDKKKYADTKGWGWARWRGKELKPYGESASFAKECVSCHIPVKSNDYVFTVPFKFTTPPISKQ